VYYLDAWLSLHTIGNEFTDMKILIKNKYSSFLCQGINDEIFELYYDETML
jgi:hypothetical protein